jgi:hypothetical protein
VRRRTNAVPSAPNFLQRVTSSDSWPPSGVCKGCAAAAVIHKLGHEQGTCPSSVASDSSLRTTDASGPERKDDHGQEID